MNFNNYLGGGETLLLRIADSLNEDDFKIITSEKSYIENECIKKTKFKKAFYSYPRPDNYHYLPKKQQLSILNWLKSIVINVEDSHFITFCMRDLHIVHAFIKEYQLSRIKITHLLLHPLDHLYLGQTVVDKILKSSKYRNLPALDTSKKLLKRLADNHSLIPMNLNVVQRLEQDTMISLKKRNIIPLPVIEKQKIEKFKKNLQSNSLSIVWLGRIVDFKIPSILSMIDLMVERPNITFSIIGYGNEKFISRYARKKKVMDRVYFLGKVLPTQLPSVLIEHDIGYGMGTSMVELTNAGLPTIVALASPEFKNFSLPVSEGLVTTQGLGNVGDSLYVKGKDLDSYPLLQDTVDYIIKNKSKYLKDSISEINNSFSLKTNLKRYSDVFNTAKPVNLSGIDLMRTNVIRKILFKLVS